eukprot:TRINITY_DN63094_c0_g1_i3.p1 TRINITY_DN63094_c0_g1~~TRINITY_DN63094_c0_g1_i3.p1  ORF type:complete len:508 (-),score=104.20 TRINITY_DN63094_c0_g1_i3:117-1601(-)
MGKGKQKVKKKSSPSGKKQTPAKCSEEPTKPTGGTKSTTTIRPYLEVSVDCTSEAEFEQVLDQVRHNCDQSSFLCIHVTLPGVPTVESSMRLRTLLDEILKNGTFVTDLSIRGLKLRVTDCFELILELLSQNRLSKLSMVHSSLRDSHASRLAQELESNSSLEILDLSLNRVNEGIPDIIRALRKQSFLQVLNLELCWMNGDAAEMIAEALRSNAIPSLREIYLSGNPLGFTAVSKLSVAMRTNTTLEVLDMGLGWELNESILRDLLQRNSSLTYLGLGQHPLPFGTALKGFAKGKLNIKPKLKFLDLHSTRLQEKQSVAMILRIIDHFPNLQWLSLYNANMRDDGLVLLSEKVASGWDSLAFLDLGGSNNKFSLPGLSALFNSLKSNQSLGILDLEIPGLKSGEFDHVKLENQTLHTLHFLEALPQDVEDVLTENFRNCTERGKLALLQFLNMHEQIMHLAAIYSWIDSFLGGYYLTAGYDIAQAQCKNDNCL